MKEETLGLCPSHTHTSLLADPDGHRDGVVVQGPLLEQAPGIYLALEEVFAAGDLRNIQPSFGECGCPPGAETAAE